MKIRWVAEGEGSFTVDVQEEFGSCQSIDDIEDKLYDLCDEAGRLNASFHWEDEQLVNDIMRELGW